MTEAKYQRELIKRLKYMFPGALVLKNDPDSLQGVPDILILYRDRWAMLEVKESSKAKRQPNQEHYVALMDGMSFAAFIHPGNEEEVLIDLQQAIGS
jgi:hypothetical protein